jgi:hypothetical protein
MKFPILAAALLLVLSACGSSDTASSSPVAAEPTATTDVVPAEPTEPTEPAEPVEEGPTNYIPGDGTYEVGVDVLAGTYENDGGTLDGAPCVAVVSTTTDTVDGFVRASNTTGHGILKVEDGQYVISQFCEDWTAR